MVIRWIDICDKSETALIKTETTTGEMIQGIIYSVKYENKNYTFKDVTEALPGDCEVITEPDEQLENMVESEVYW